MVTIIASLHEKWWEKMKAGEKLLEIRKTRPRAVSYTHLNELQPGRVARQS